MLIYDLEIVRAIPDRKRPMLPGIEYCEGWDDHANMGCSVLGVYDTRTKRYRVFMTDNRHECVMMAADPTNWPLVSFNGLGFDNKVLAHSLPTPCSCPMPPLPTDPAAYYDILVEVWAAAGLGPTFQYPSHAGYGMGAVCGANFDGVEKSGEGAAAPILWQQGRIGEVIDYCLNDVKMTKDLADKIMHDRSIICPKSGRLLRLRPLHAHIPPAGLVFQQEADTVVVTDDDGEVEPAQIREMTDAELAS